MSQSATSSSGSRLAPRMARMWRHWRSTAAKGRRAFPPETLDAIGKAITAGEQTHRSELRLIVEHAMPFDALWAGMGIRERAIALFAEYGIWDTEDNCGVLIYVNLAEHRVEIVTDRNVGRKIDNIVWKRLCALMTQGFAQGQFHAATLAALEQVNALLAEHFPAKGARANELPDRPIML
ncbi:TPM domain-containing protein [Massilia genomosp. 1]|uniref:TPM domain-containing protein n=1 Tax=Massilia genomosp. 1 TaxID=2609280 RepID=A0ABX0MN78_9BURK|nr:TPM domain-containing protein [Massilia genomosp. 1]NHZ64232.1 TPM domain-containing protein [Massilia genomosp. 1]